MNAGNLNVAGSKMSAMLCCSGEKDSAGRDLKSAQNTPSRQPMQPPYTMGTGQFMAPTQQPQGPGQQGQPQQNPYMQQQQQFRQPMYGPPPLQQQQGPPGGPQGPRLMGPGQQQNMAMNNYSGGGVPGMAPTQGPKDDYRKVGPHTLFLNDFVIFLKCI